MRLLDNLKRHYSLFLVLYSEGLSSPSGVKRIAGPQIRYITTTMGRTAVRAAHVLLRLPGA
jgi:hypothetical protein